MVAPLPLSADKSNSMLFSVLGICVDVYFWESVKYRSSKRCFIRSENPEYFSTAEFLKQTTAFLFAFSSKNLSSDRVGGEKNFYWHLL